MTMSSIAPRISFIIVNYRSRHLLSECLASLSRGCMASYEVIIINNDHEPLSRQLFGDTPAIQIIENGRNCGFGAAINRGAASARGAFLCFFNPDARIAGKNFSSLLSFFEKDDTLGLVGGRLVQKNGAVQPWSAGEEVTLWSTIWHKVTSRQHMPWHSEKNRSVAWISGAAMVIRKEIFDVLGGFDERFFLYFEDVDLCRRSRELGKKILYVPSVRIIHHGGGSVKSRVVQRQYYDASQELYFEKHYGIMLAFLLRIIRFFYRLSAF
ncbi:MAG TPA: glycosyltransferase family 2 protein [Patescibacteria group bacterium]|nr:glycosyltransferase family 2 protein [Patescibacteria group bacterium]